ncbi:hypothetical protein WG909_13150 [Peptostreptococcaceae bacterium AGR-M142]
MGFRVDSSSFLRNIAKTELKLRAAVGLYAHTASKKLESSAKQNATWTDRTAQARQTIQGGYYWQGYKCFIYLAGNKNYSPYLEFCNEKKYAILYPTILKESSYIVKGFSNILNN